MQKPHLSTVFSFINLSFIQGSNVLIQLFLIPIITRKVGLSEFGFIMLASSYAALVSILINFGSNQSGVKDVALHKDEPSVLSTIVYSIYWVRILFYILSFLVLLFISNWFLPEHTSVHFLFANLLIIGELLNPFFFFVGLQKLFLYNLVNLFSKLLSVILILFFINGPEDGIWINFLLGLSQIIGFLFLLIFLIKKHLLFHFAIPTQKIIQYIKQNSYLTGNNLSVQLQQSIFLFTVSGLGNPALLGAYSLCDKIVWSARMIIISFFNAVYPRAVNLYKENPTNWYSLKRKLNIGIGIILSMGGLVLFFGADWIVLLITSHPDELSTLFIKCICLVPLVAGLNALNVAELLLKNKYSSIFTIALILLSISVVLAFVFLQFGKPEQFGFFPILAEIGSIPLYLYFIKLARNLKENN